MCDAFDVMQPSRVRQNLLMAGSNRLGGGTGTPVVSQRSESGQGILGVKAGRGVFLLYVVVVGGVCHASEKVISGGENKNDQPEPGAQNVFTSSS
jgi:hypothetical protein